MGLIQRGSNYFIDYRFKGRRVRERVGPNKRLAEQALAIRQAEIAQGRFQIRTKRVLLFRDFAATYLDFARTEKRSWKRDQTLLTNLLPCFGHRDLDDVTPFLIEAYKKQRAAAVKPATVNREIALLKHMFNLAIRWGRAERNPMRDVRMFREEPTAERVLTAAEVDALLGACSEKYSRPIVLTALHTGMRLNEILSLQWAQVDLEQRVITVLHSKNGRIRKIPVNAVLHEMLRSLRSRQDYEYVFIYYKTKGPVGKFRTAWLNALARSGIAHCRFHDLRHTFATNLVAAGVDLVTVKELLGHSTIVMTTRYAHSAPESKRRAVAVLEDRVRTQRGPGLDPSPKLLESPPGSEAIQAAAT